MKGKVKVKYVFLLIIAIVMIVIGSKFVFFLAGKWNEAGVLKQMVERLSAESRVAEVLVTQTAYNEEDKVIETTIKFLEYGAGNKPLEPQYFTFRGNVIQFQSLVIRFADHLVKAGKRLKGKSAYIFLKAFVLDDEDTQVMTITSVDEIPQGYKVEGIQSEYETKLWESFWQYALDPETRKLEGVKSAQIEAPGTMFVPGTIYTLVIEHDGGLRIDSEPIPEILKGEKI